MPDFLDRLGGQLAAAQEPAVAPRGSGRGRTLGTLRARVLVVGIGALVVAAPAAAIIHPWQPELSRPGIDGPVTTSSAGVLASASDVLAVLRRPQTDADRTLTAPLIRRVGSANLVDGVQTDSIRSLAPDWALVPVHTVLSRRGGASVHDQLCLTDGNTMTCQPAAKVAVDGVWVLAGSRLASVVPDNVARVRYVSSGGDSSTVDVHDNFFAMTLSADRPVPSDDGPPAPPRSGQLQWLDAKGDVVGPERQPLP